MKVTAVFDIGKTNKKLILFDQDFKEVFRTHKHFDEIQDEDGYPCEDLKQIERWIKDASKEVLASPDFDLQALNFSAFGASLVHLDANGHAVAPMYNYLKPIPEEILESFYKEHGDQLALAVETASPSLGMLNAGLQLYWLKHTRPLLFERINCSLFLPHYLSWLFSGVAVNDYTSLGCHTMMWDYHESKYHAWVYAEGMDRLLPPVVETNTSVVANFNARPIRIGVGIHDSSAALIPFMRAQEKSFALISTGTWSVTLNPFSGARLDAEDLKDDCLNYMTIDGNPVRASRLFLGNEHDVQVMRLNAFFNKGPDYHGAVQLDQGLLRRIKDANEHRFSFESIKSGRTQPQETQLEKFKTFEEAYHQLMFELVELQVQSVDRAIGGMPISSLHVNGGFANNEIFINLLSNHYVHKAVHASDALSGSALGAAMVISNEDGRMHYLNQPGQATREN